MTSLAGRARFWMVVQVAFMLLFGSVMIVEIVRVELLAHRTHDALCAFRTDLRARAANSQRFLDEHHGKYPIPGFPVSRAQIEAQIAGQNATLYSLRKLGCSDPTP